MRVFLIHGMGRTPISMWVLRHRLQRAGYPVTLFGYLVTMSDLDDIRERFVACVVGALAADAESNGESHPSYAVVGHSLGNVVTRLASPRLPPGFCRFAMLAPPNRSPVIARTLGGNALFRATTRDAGQKLVDREFFRQLPVPDVPSLIIAGNRGPRATWLPFAGEPNDTILRVAETHLEGVPTIEVPAIHSFLMNRRDVTEALLRFFESGAVPAEHGSEERAALEAE